MNMTSKPNEPEVVLESHMDPSMEEPARTMPLLGGMARPDGLPSPGEETSGISGTSGSLSGRGSLVLLVVFSIAAGSLYLMRKSQSEFVNSEEVSQVELRVEEALARLSSAASASETQLISNGTSDGTEKIVSMFSADPAGQQVPLEYLQKNPFVLPEVEKAQAPDPATTAKSDTGKREHDILANLKQEARGGTAHAKGSHLESLMRK